MQSCSVEIWRSRFKIVFYSLVTISIVFIIHLWNLMWRFCSQIHQINVNSLPDISGYMDPFRLSTYMDPHIVCPFFVIAGCLMISYLYPSHHYWIKQHHLFLMDSCTVDHALPLSLSLPPSIPPSLPLSPVHYLLSPINTLFLYLLLSVSLSPICPPFLPPLFPSSLLPSDLIQEIQTLVAQWPKIHFDKMFGWGNN